MEPIFYVAFWLILALIGSTVGSNKGRRVDGFFLTLLLGPLGLLIVAFLSPSAKEQARQNIKVEKEELELRTRMAHVSGGRSSAPPQRGQQRP
jgi:hypothetical protein